MGPEDWQRDYEASRYLREIPTSALQGRLEDLASNLWSTDAAGNVTPARDPDIRDAVLRLILHTMMERWIRTGGTSPTFDERALREAAAAGYRPPRLKVPFTGSPICFAKFGRRDHIADSFNKGILRIAPASSYDDPSLNPAQTDKELEHVTVTPNEHLVFKLYTKDADGRQVETPVQKKELFRYMAVPDFYVWCCGLGYDARLFHEFQAEAVLVIRDKDAFCTRLAEAVARKVPKSVTIDRHLSYYDPYTVRREQLVPCFTKHFRYLYQNEYRFVWTVPDGTSLEPFFVEFGPLHDIAEFRELA